MLEADVLARRILGRSKIKNKIVVLCEGDIPQIEWDKPLSPQAYARLETLPDANFYLNCIPRNWHGERLPVFFNCGDRGKVFATYSAMLALQAENPDNYYLDPKKLYAMVDLDVQPGHLPEGYDWSTTESIHEALYDDGLLKAEIDDRHRFWVTALVHKEAFFVLPSAAATWSQDSGAHFQGLPIDLPALYRSIAEAIVNDKEISTKLPVVQSRLERFQHGKTLTCADPATLCNAWLDAFSSADANQHESLLRVLVAFAKVKPLWEKIDAGVSGTHIFSAENFRDQLALKVARHISELPPQAHSLAAFFAWLERRR